jgi:hypothetical protein
VALKSPRQPDVRRLVDALDAEMTLLYPPESTHLMNIEALCSPAVRFLVARLDGDAVGDYQADPLSVFLEKDLQDSSRAPTTPGNGQAASP